MVVEISLLLGFRHLSALDSDQVCSGYGSTISHVKTVTKKVSYFQIKGHY